MFTTAAVPSEKWIVKYTVSVPNTGYLPFQNSAGGLLASNGSNTLLVLGYGSDSKYVTLNTYGNITQSIDATNTPVQYSWPYSLGQYVSGSYYLTSLSAYIFNSTLSTIISRSVVDNNLDATSSYGISSIVYNSNFTWGLGYRNNTSTSIYSLVVVMFNSTNVTQWIRNITPPTNYQFAGTSLCPVSTDMELLGEIYDPNGTLLNKVFTARVANSAGTVSNQRLIGDSTYSLRPICMSADVNNKYILVNGTLEETYLLKINSSGVLQWQKRIAVSDINYYFPPTYSDVFGEIIAIDSSGDVYLVRRSNSTLYQVFIRITKISAAGTIVFSNNISIPSLTTGTYITGQATISVSGTSVVVCATYYNNDLNPTNLTSCFIKFSTTDTTLPLGTYQIEGHPDLYISTDTATSLPTSTLSVTTVAYTTSTLSVTYLSKVDSNDSGNFSTSTIIPSINKAQLP